MRADVARTTTDLITQWIDRHVHQRDLLLHTIADGKTAFRNKFFRELRGLPISDEMAERTWAFLAGLKDRFYPEFETAAKALDALEVRETRPPTEREIAEGWEVESASSEEGRRFLYGADGGPHQLVDQLRKGMD